SDAALVVTTLSGADIADDEFLFFSWKDAQGQALGENDYFPKAYKAYELMPAKVSSTWSDRDGKAVLTLQADQPAFFATASVDVPGYSSDNALTLLPGRPVELVFHPRHGAKVTSADLAKSLKIRNLAETF